MILSAGTPRQAAITSARALLEAAKEPAALRQWADEFHPAAAPWDYNGATYLAFGAMMSLLGSFADTLEAVDENRGRSRSNA